MFLYIIKTTYFFADIPVRGHSGPLQPYVRRIGPATYVLRFFTCKCTHRKRSTSAYEEYELRIEEYELRMLTYVRRTRDVPFVS